MQIKRNGMLAIYIEEDDSLEDAAEWQYQPPNSDSFNWTTFNPKTSEVLERYYTKGRYDVHIA